MFKEGDLVTYVIKSSNGKRPARIVHAVVDKICEKVVKIRFDTFDGMETYKLVRHENLTMCEDIELNVKKVGVYSRRVK